jgi:hypothetical protein
MSWEISRKTKAAYCWDANDWGILAPSPEPGIFIAGYVRASRPQEVNLSPTVCIRLDLLHYLKERPTPTTWLANGVDTLAHESLHVYGFRNEAVTECVAMQLTARTTQLLGAGEAYGRALASKLWNNYSVANKPIGYWSSNCHDGGPWDIAPKSSSWPTP